MPAGRGTEWTWLCCIDMATESYMTRADVGVQSGTRCRTSEWACATGLGAMHTCHSHARLTTGHRSHECQHGMCHTVSGDAALGLHCGNTACPTGANTDSGRSRQATCRQAHRRQNAFCLRFCNLGQEAERRNAKSLEYSNLLV